MSPISTPFATLLSLLAIATASPIEERSVPFSGQGNLVALKGGLEVGCLTATQQITADTSACAKFTSTLLTGPDYYREVKITSSAGACGYKYIVVSPPTAENAKYKIGCGPGEATLSGAYIQPGRNENSAYTIMMVGGQRNFTTSDALLPAAGATKDVFTDEWMFTPTDFQIGWKAL